MPCIAKCAMLVMMGTLSAAIFLRNQHSGSFSLQQKSKDPAVRYGPSALARVYRKYGKATPVHDEVTANSIGDDIITPTSNDKEYLTPVTIGGQTLNLQVDTGSSDLWVSSPLLPTAEQRGHKIYDPSLSDTSKALANDTWEIIYGDGSQGASGGVCTDTVAVGTIVIQNQAVQLVAKLTARFLDDISSDGIHGFAFNSINTVQPDQRNTFFDNVKVSRASPLFTATLKHQVPGSFDLGYIDATKYTGPITYTEVDSSYGFWDITMESYTIGSGSARPYSLHGSVDTGSPLILVDDSVVAAYYREVEGAAYDNAQGAYTFACNVVLPDITLCISGYNAVVAGRLINIGPTDATRISCFGGLQSSDGFSRNIFGDPLLKSQFVVFDSNGPRMGFAPQA